MDNPQGDVAYISYIGVNECFKRMGIGTKLINRVENAVFFNSIEFEVYKNNLSACLFYTKHSFIYVEDRDDRWLKRKILDIIE